MADIRDALAAAVQARLLAAGTHAGNNVFLWRDWPLNSAKVPAIVVRARRLDKTDITGGNGIPQFDVTVLLELDCFASATADIDAETLVRTIAEEADLQALGIIIGPPQTFRRVAQVSSEIDLTAEGAAHMATAELRYAFETAEYTVPDLINILERIRIAAIEEFAAGDSDVNAALTNIIAGADFPMV